MVAADSAASAVASSSAASAAALASASAASAARFAAITSATSRMPLGRSFGPLGLPRPPPLGLPRPPPSRPPAPPPSRPPAPPPSRPLPLRPPAPPPSRLPRSAGPDSRLSSRTFFCSLRLVGRSGFGRLVPAGISIPSNAAICGNSGPRRSVVFFSSSSMVVGATVGVTRARTGEKAAASRTADQRSPESSGSNELVAASPRRLASAGGNITPAFGGCDESRSARMTRPTVRAASTSSSQFAISSDCLVARDALSSSAMARVDSSRATIGSALAATTLRRSRRSRCCIWR